MSQNTECIKLNVGGSLFVTSKETVMRCESMLSSMFSGRIPIKTDDDGYVFIDRDGSHFRTILNFLRDGNVTKPSTEQESEELKREAKFYCISELVQFLENDEQGQEFSDSTVGVYPTPTKWKYFRFEKTGHITKYNHVGSKEAIQPIKIPLMADNTMSLSLLKKAFGSATCLYAMVNPYDAKVLVKSSKLSGKTITDEAELYTTELCPIKGDKIYPLQGGWQNHSYCVAASHDFEIRKPMKNKEAPKK